MTKDHKQVSQDGKKLEKTPNKWNKEVETNITGCYAGSSSPRGPVHPWSKGNCLWQESHMLVCACRSQQEELAKSWSIQGEEKLISEQL